MADDAIVGLTIFADEYDDPNAGGGRRALIDGLGGNDEIDGNTRNDFLIGNTGDDTLTGGEGDDTFAFKFNVNVETVVIPGENTVTTETKLFDGPPGTNADWKAWENYEIRLNNFFNNGGYEALKAQGYTFDNMSDAKFLELKALFNGWTDDAGTNSSIVYLGPPDATGTNSGPKKIANVWGNDPNHDLDNNLAHGVGGNAAYRVIDNAYLTATKMTVVEGEDQEIVTTTITGSDGADQITDFHLNGEDVIYLGATGDGPITEQMFYDAFSVAKIAGPGHENLRISLDGGGWSVEVNLVGLDGSQGVNGKAYADLTEAADLETFAWQHLINGNNGLASQPASFQTYVSNDWLV